MSKAPTPLTDANLDWALALAECSFEYRAAAEIRALRQDRAELVAALKRFVLVRDGHVGALGDVAAAKDAHRLLTRLAAEGRAE